MGLLHTCAASRWLPSRLCDTAIASRATRFTSLVVQLVYAGSRRFHKRGINHDYCYLNTGATGSLVLAIEPAARKIPK
jgi:hypothetical protein